MSALIDPLTAFLLVILFIVAGVSLVLALRNRLSFRIAMRNVRRGKWRTVLLVLGLLVGTTIISSSLVVGDTIDQLIVHAAYETLGFTDEGVYNQSPTGAYTFFPYSTFTALNQSVAGNPQIVGVTPEIIGSAQALDRNNGVPQTALNLIGVNGNQSGALGSFTTTSGASLAGPAPGEVLLDQGAANNLGAVAGHRLTLYVGPTAFNTSVQAIVLDDNRGGFLGGGFGGSGSVFVDLGTAQQLESKPGQVNFIAVTNAGTLTAGVGISDSVSGALNKSLASIPSASGLAVHELLSDTVSFAATAGSSLATFFLVFGLFSIIAGAMLIVGIFVMLAEERKGEMGMVRAIGLRRGQLVASYYFEGLAYSAGSALLGTLLGIGVGFGLTYAFSQLFGSGGLSSAQILASFTVRPESMLTAYVLGFLLTLATVVATSARTSRLNIVRAIRSIPEPPPTMGVYTRLAYGGAGLAVVGALLLLATYRGSADISLPVIGGALVIMGVALLASRFVRNRPVFTLASIALLLWSGFAPISSVLGTQHSGGFFILFTEGILLVFGAIMLYIFNSDTVVALVSRMVGSRPSSVSIARIGLSNPSRRPGRTAISLAIFALVVFTLVTIASFGSTLEANVSNQITVQTGGYTFAGFSATPIRDLPGAIANNSTLSGLYSHVVPFVSGGVLETVPGFAQNPYGDAVYSAPAGRPPSQDFYTSNSFAFSTTWHGMTTAAVWSALGSGAAYAVVDASYGPSSGGGGFGSGFAHPTVSAGESIVLTNPVNANRSTVQVLGVMSESLVAGIFVSPSVARSLGYTNESAFLLTVAPGVDQDHAAQVTKAAMLPFGLVLINLAAVVSTNLGFTQAFVGLLQLFVGLGLAVGIASLGILALRAVQERRAEIGMLRATGFTQSMIFRSFLLEFSFVTILGISIGTVLGILLIYSLAAAPGSAAAGITTVSIPWGSVALIAGLAYGLTILAVLGPSLRAARLPPAEAVRPTE
ncbi:MAG: FtsX-like permease family protein [Thermoplasmata archaeon]|nr:FtsX-like permease family protein [Thermoplasmata archaeon]